MFRHFFQLGTPSHGALLSIGPRRSSLRASIKAGKKWSQKNKAFCLVQLIIEAILEERGEIVSAHTVSSVNVALIQRDPLSARICKVVNVVDSI